MKILPSSSIVASISVCSSSVVENNPSPEASQILISNWSPIPRIYCSLSEKTFLKSELIESIRKEPNHDRYSHLLLLSNEENLDKNVLPGIEYHYD